MNYQPVAEWPDSSPALSPEPLTEAELRVAALMMEGWDNADIAAQLCLSLNTVKKHVGQVLAKLDARNRTHAVVLLLRRD